MGVRKTWAILGAAAAMALGACAGGSGSGGFDITESAAIRQAIEAYECVRVDTLVICPMTQPGEDAPGSERVDATMAAAETVPCLEMAGTCTFTPTFLPGGFPDGARFNIASRQSDTDPWMVSPPVEVTPGGLPSLSSPVSVPERDAASGVSSVQFAVLVFLTPREFPSGPVAELASTAADFAFVTDLLPAEATASHPGP